MHKIYKPDFRGVLSLIRQFPHCDQRILHAPGECQYCDAHSEWQALRVAWGIAFTGWLPDGVELPCPADKTRGDTHQKWGGNIARPLTAADPVNGPSVGAAGGK